ncbi:hypothetical protein ACRFV7_005335 [Klebsiella oxytoca]|jgi:hypothetical protein|uniref:Uncharacterized protein n=5 Tax=Klebsiella/Raoultella group TaxID=2890311 RepID=A0A7H0EVK5_KLEVA|nr:MULTISPECIES: hypothetical protein [Enterobacteriaceae]AFN34973.1 hypothetical protein A225_R1p0155 [Klebsiella michiganensis E718]AGO89119.1 hypothetical protein pKpNDM1_00279 [Raoultella planticola]ANS55402.1 hypothetical protein [Klebsiella pneumoniae]ASI57146.1 hypothetical protein CA210_02445 [Raoultella ornithinolytica]AUT25301.1 hypothetical protein CEA73_27265 [Klebsiella pneumoniae]
MYSRFMNDPLDEQYLLSPAIVGSYADGEIPAEEIEVRDAVIRFKVTGDQALSMNLFHRLFHYQRYREVRASFDKSGLTLVDVVNRTPFHKAAMRRIYSDLPEQSIARRVLVDFIR